MHACVRVCPSICLYVCVKTRGLLSLSTITGAMSVSAGSEPTEPGLHVVTVSPPRPASTGYHGVFSVHCSCSGLLCALTAHAVIVSLHCSCSRLLCTLLMKWSSPYTAHAMIFSVHCSCNDLLSTLLRQRSSLCTHSSCSGLFCTLLLQ